MDGIMIKKFTMRGMISTRTILVILIIIATIVIIGGVSFFLVSQDQPQNQDSSPSSQNPFFNFFNPKPSQNPSQNNGAIPPGSTGNIDVALTAGGTLSVRNFLGDPGVSNLGTSTADTVGYYLLSKPYPTGVAPDSNGSGSYYDIEYFPMDKSFLITLYREPLGEVRRAAAEDLGNRLGISGKALCSLVVEVGTPVWVNDTLGARSLGLPGCPGAQPFEGD